MSMFDWVGDGVQWLNEQFNEVEQWASNVWHGNTGDQAVPAPELVEIILASKGAVEWHQGATSLDQIAKDHDEVSADVQRLSTGLESVWSGNGAEAARGRIRPLGDASAVAGETYVGNSRNLADLAHGFDQMKSALQAMPKTPPHKNFFDTATPWDTDTEEQITTYNRIAQENLDRYHGYAKQAQASGQGLKNDYGQLTAFDGQIKLAAQAPGPSPSPHKPHSGPGNHSYVQPEPTGVGGVADTPPPPVEGSESKGFARPQEPASSGGHRPSAEVGDPSGGGDMRTAGAVPPPLLPEQRSGSTPALPVPGSATGSGGDSSWSGGFEGGTSPGPGRPGGSAGRGRSGGPGGGAGSGVGAEGSMRGAGRGLAGARGGGVVGGVPPAGGKGEDDKEHQRKYGVDDDSVLGLTDDDGERLVDPRTGLPATPPTIGG
ncbi:hypothetical protein [Amycolatopsis panacis]|uniref:PPE domain-containing protein n=1 Tax=Amycolatopsis panacis TaxID=2340917 RepID=A0A419HZL7_9PSEU|nr:hypothetical protein [Amycolatopsis panacis]RJQ82744.1 hypothetical protein D5S19_21205 [Amycolatopsis panacis]